LAESSPTPLHGALPISVGLSSSGSSSPNGSITSYSWNFGDGTSGSGATASHTYTAAGNYTATLTVFDSAGKTAASSVTIAVTAPIGTPVAKASATPTSV